MVTGNKAIASASSEHSLVDAPLICPIELLLVGDTLFHRAVACLFNF